MQVERLSRLTADPFHTDHLAMHARVTGASELLPEVLRFADAAALEIEAAASLALLNQSIRVTFPSWEAEDWQALPIAPLVEGAPVTVTAGGVAVTSFSVIHGMRPALRLDVVPEGEVVVTYQAGFGATANAIPADLLYAINDQAAAAFDTRGNPEVKGFGMSPHMARVVARYRRVAL